MAGGARLARAPPAAGGARARATAAFDVVRDITGAARAADVVGRADAVGAGGRARARRRRARAVGGPHARQDVGDARHAAPPARGRAPRSGWPPRAASSRAITCRRGCATTASRASRPTRCSTRSRSRSTAAGSRARSWPPQVARLTGVEGLDDKLRGGFGDLLKPAAFRGDLCFAPNDGRNVRFARPDQWLGSWEPIDRDEAMRAVARRYLAVYGPGDARDLRALVRHHLARPGREVARRARGRGGRRRGRGRARGDAGRGRGGGGGRRAGGRRAAAAGVRPLRRRRAARRRRRAGAGDARRVYRPQGWLSPVLLVDGRMAGVWSHERKGARLTVAIEPFEPLEPWVRDGAEAEAERLAAFVEARSSSPGRERRSVLEPPIGG